MPSVSANCCRVLARSQSRYFWRATCYITTNPLAEFPYSSRDQKIGEGHCEAKTTHYHNGHGN